MQLKLIAIKDSCSSNLLIILTRLHQLIIFHLLVKETIKVYKFLLFSYLKRN